MTEEELCTQIEKQKKAIESLRQELSQATAQLERLKKENRKRVYSVPQEIGFKYGGEINKAQQMVRLPHIYSSELNAISRAIRSIHFRKLQENGIYTFKKMEELTHSEYEKYCSILDNTLSALYDKKPPVTATTDGNTAE